jgi:peptidoglycan/LPS O-acetylase OafA/YrhL
MRMLELDALRGVSILTVMAAHLHVGIVSGWLGIDLFFVLSGYLITGALLRDSSLLRFYQRRVTRILPPVAAMVALALAIAPGFEMRPMAYFYANFVPSESLGSLAHTWYLSIEEQFYLVWPVVFVFFPRRVVLGIVIGIAWAFHAWTALNGTDLDTIFRSTFSRMDALAIGCALALVRPRISTWVGYAALVLGVIAFFTAKPAPLTVAMGLALYPIVSAGLIAASPQIAILRVPALAYIGERALGLFLYHYPIFCALEPLQDRQRPVEWMFIAALKIALSFAAAEISYRTIERLRVNPEKLRRLALAAVPAFRADK